MRLLIAVAALGAWEARAQDPGSVDASFNPIVTNQGLLPNVIVVQPDGKVLVGGVFVYLGGVEHSCIARLNTDGSPDTSFNAQADAEVSAIAVQPDGKIVIGGFFSNVDGVARGGVARLNADGTLDAGFDPGSGVASTGGLAAPETAVRALALQADGGVVIGGGFDQVNGAAHTSLARLKSDGSVDASFAPVLTETQNQINQATVRAVLVQPDGKIVFSGGFETVNGSAYTNLARLDTDGSLDPAFVLDGPDSTSTNFENVVALALQADGKIVAGGTFTSVHGTARKSAARFNADGSLDTGFNPGAAITFDVFGINTVALQADGKIIFGGGFSTFAAGQYHQNSIIRVNPDGSLDNGFAGDTSRGTADGDLGDGFQVSAVAVQADGRLIVGGDYSIVDGVQQPTFARLNADGSLDAGYVTQFQSRGFIFGLALDSGGKIVIGGGFTTVDGASRYELARLNPDGTLDTTFVPDLGGGPGLGVTVSFDVQQVAIQSDGKVLYSTLKVVRTAPNTQVVESFPFARLNADGTPDSTFNVTLDNGSSGSPSVLDIVPQADGKILIAGNFTSVDGVARSGFARVNADGSIDTGFQTPALIGVGPTGTPALPSVSKIVLQTDGKILIAGNFSQTDTTHPADLIRLNADGSQDTTFQAVLPLAETQDFQQPTVNAVAVQPDGQILVSGFFNSTSFQNGGSIVRLNADGSADNTFNAPNKDATALLPQQDGKILIGGNFIAINGVGNSGLARLNADGSLDTAFTVTLTDRSRFALVPNFINATGLQTDGKILVAGIFDSVNGATHISLTRLMGDPVVNTLPVVNLKAKAVPLLESGANGQGVFKLTRTGDLSQQLVVNLQLKGKAQNGVDYTIGNVAPGVKTLTKKIKIGKLKKKIRVTAVDLGITGGATKNIKLVLLPGDGYTVGTQSVAKIKLVEDQ